MPRSNPTVAAIMMVQNECQIIADCIGHMLNTLGVAKVYVTDNGSTDGTQAVLQWLAHMTGRVIVETDHGPFRQAEVLTELAHRATAEGAGWLLPSDADEFLWLRKGTLLPMLYGSDDIGGYRVNVRNFLQTRLMRRDWPGSIVTMCVSANPTGTVASAQADVTTAMVPFVRMRYPTKLLVRASRQLQLSFGHHDATGTDGPLVPLDAGELLHAPIRAFQDLNRRVETGRRAAEVTPEPGQSWHVKRVAAMDDAELAAEWRRNSFPFLRPVSRGSTRLDFRLSAIGIRQASFRRQVLGHVSCMVPG